MKTLVSRRGKMKEDIKAIEVRNGNFLSKDFNLSAKEKVFLSIASEYWESFSLANICSNGGFDFSLQK